MGQRKLAVIISYFNLVIGLVINLFFTPLLIVSLGDVDYSIYKVMQSFAGPLYIFNLGLSTIVARNIVKHNTDDYEDIKEKRNKLAIAIIVSIIISLFVIVAGIVLCNYIPKMYAKTYTFDQIKLAKDIFIIFVFSTVFHILTDTFSGTIIGHEKYVVNSTVSLGKKLFKNYSIDFSFILKK